MKARTCAITNKNDVIDDCYIKLEFGYGSKRDMETYSFGPVRDKTAEKILQYIGTLLKKNKTLDDFKYKPSWMDPEPDVDLDDLSKYND
jgi:hypothetical protein